jgi:NitT/TauT family transport system substrate-binding protein
VLVACSTPSGANLVSATNGAAAAPVTLRLGYFPNITHATAIVGVEAGIFARDLGPSVSLQTSQFNAGPAAVEALFADALDASYVGPNPAINAFIQSHGEAVRVLAGATSGGSSLVVQPDVNSAADLVGKGVASPQLGNTQDVALRHWLSTQGLKTTPTGGGDVFVVPQDNSQTLQTFRSGQIAGAWVPEPWATRLVQEGGGKVLVDERDLWPNGQFPTTLLIVRAAFMQQHPDVVDGLVRAHTDATDYVNSQPAQAQRQVNEALRRLTGSSLSDEAMAGAWKNMSFTVDPLAAALRQSAANATDLGFLQLGGQNIDQIYNLDALNRVLRASGKPEVSS